MARTVTCTLRIAAISKPHNIRLNIAASIFVAAGVLILYIVNLIFTQRLLRSFHPRFGWSKAFSFFFPILFGLIILTLAIVITVTVQSFYTLRPRTRTIDRDFQLYSSTVLTIISFLPIPMVLIALIARRHSTQRPEKFGVGRMRTKVLVLLTSATFLCLGASFRCGTSWKAPVPRTQPLPRYFSRACFYVFNFAVEVLVVYLYALMRIDLRFHVPNGASGPGSYTVRADDSEDIEKRGNGRSIGQTMPVKGNARASDVPGEDALEEALGAKEAGMSKE